MASPSCFQDVPAAHLRGALLKTQGVTVSDGAQCFEVASGEKSAIIDIHLDTCSGLAIEQACIVLGVDCVAVYSAIIKSLEKAEHAR